MLVATHPFALFDYFRVPYTVEARSGDVGSIEADGGRVIWPVRGAGAAGRRGRWLVGESPIYATLCDEQTVARWKRDAGGTWTEVVAIREVGGATSGAVWRNDSGTLVLPFDPGDAMLSCWSEAYTTEAGAARVGLKSAALRSYYTVRPLLPRPAQLALRRAFSRVQARAAFPRWPIETGLHDLYDTLFGWFAETLGGALPGLSPWPRGKSWALVLTHDVEHADGYRAMPIMRDIEQRLGYRSAWYLVPERDYEVDDATVQDLRDGGFEVGVHGLHHDGRDLVPSVLPGRLGAIQRWRDRWQAVGFRSPATHRDWEAMPRLGFDYDSSSFDTDPFEPQSGGCCTWLPFHNSDLIELPMTLTMDHTVFVILRRGGSLWEEKTELLRRRGGMALLLTHPDYMQDPGRLAAYQRFLEAHATDETAWRALPCEVSAWWRRRSESSIDVSAERGMRIVGPAADDGEIVFLGDAPAGGRAR
jgi:peptidoglycan/xylan/chitin deacetylase (PgdA/CDA1 family)